MIISASRRTDIPNYYSKWFYNRIEEEVVYVRNPMNHKQTSKIDLSPDIVDCIVFWTKNPRNMISGLEKLNNYKYYFQFSLNGYGYDIEPYIPDKKKVLIPIFRELSELIGSGSVIWRYDPILLNNKYTIQYHIETFKYIAKQLKGYSHRVVISFIDFYPKIKSNIHKLSISPLNMEDMYILAEFLSDIAKEYGFTIQTCSEAIDLKNVNIEHGCCIDKNVIEDIIGCKISCKKDKSQRLECGCIESIDIGTYDTCKNGCIYCYANSSDIKVKNTIRKYIQCTNVHGKK